MELTLGKRIAAGRKKLGLTQDQLAEKLGVTAQAVSKWENDQSCPDITMLPKLADIFGTSTDALLGMEKQRIHEAEVVEPSRDWTEPEGLHIESEGIHIQGGDVDIQLGGVRRGALSFAMWVLLYGCLLLGASLLHKSIGWWDLCWPSFMLVFGLMAAVRHFSFMNLGFTLCGGYFLLGCFVPMAFNKSLVMPVLIVLFGLTLLVDALRKPKKFHIHHSGSQQEESRRQIASYTCENERFDCDISFGGASQLVNIPHLRGGNAEVSFGELTLDLSGCQEFAPECHIDLSCSFGQLTLLVPKICHVRESRETSFGSVEIKGAPDPDAAAEIIADCDVSFGEICIRYI